MQYFDKNGKEIKAGMKILMDDGSIEMVYDTDDQYGNPSLGINASNEEFLKLHPNWAREYYSLSNFNPSSIEICPSEQEIRDELEQLTPIIEGTELRLDYYDSGTMVFNGGNLQASQHFILWSETFDKV